jgi:hypothetical protein
MRVEYKSGGDKAEVKQGREGMGMVIERRKERASDETDLEGR